MKANRKKRVLRIVAKLEAIQDELEKLQSEEEEAFDNLSETKQEDQVGEDFNFRMEQLDMVSVDLETPITDLTELANT